MDRVQIRIELLRIAFGQLRDDNRALDVARTWEAWVLEVAETQDAAETPKRATPRPK